MGEIMENLLKIEQLEEFYASNNIGIFCYLTNNQKLAEIIDSGISFSELDNYIYKEDIYIGIVDKMAMECGKLIYTSKIIDDIDKDREVYYRPFRYAFPVDLTTIRLLK